MIKTLHYIVTRFNLGLYRTNGDADAWFDARARIFRKLTLPSVAAQSNQDFTWALLIDSETPKKHIAFFQELLAENYVNGFKLVFIAIPLAENWTPKRYGERLSCDIDYGAFTDWLEGQAKYVLQTRLDNDDALTPHAVQIIRDGMLASKQPYCLDFPKGYMIDTINRKAYLAHHWRGGTPFLSLLQPVSPKFRCIYALTHQKIATKYQYEPRDKRIWVMNIHDRNVSNRVFDWMVEKEIDFDAFCMEQFHEKL